MPAKCSSSRSSPDAVTGYERVCSTCNTPMSCRADQVCSRQQKAIDLETIRRCEGIFEGLLSPEEQAAFERCIKDGVAIRWYQGAGGFMGLAKVKAIRQ